jgi:hypothetical protein
MLHFESRWGYFFRPYTVRVFTTPEAPHVKNASHTEPRFIIVTSRLDDIVTRRLGD